MILVEIQCQRYALAGPVAPVGGGHRIRRTGRLERRCSTDGMLGTALVQGSPMEEAGEATREEAGAILVGEAIQ